MAAMSSMSSDSIGMWFRWFRRSFLPQASDLSVSPTAAYSLAGQSVFRKVVQRSSKGKNRSNRTQINQETSQLPVKAYPSRRPPKRALLPDLVHACTFLLARQLCSRHFDIDHTSALLQTCWIVNTNPTRNYLTLRRFLLSPRWRACIVGAAFFALRRLQTNGRLRQKREPDWSHKQEQDRVDYGIRAILFPKLTVKQKPVTRGVITFIAKKMRPQFSMSNCERTYKKSSDCKQWNSKVLRPGCNLVPKTLWQILSRYTSVQAKINN